MVQGTECNTVTNYLVTLSTTCKHDRLTFDIKGGAYPRPRMVARIVTTLQLFAAETCNKFLKIEHHDSIVYSKHELILTFLEGATSDLTAGNTTQERLDLPARFCSSLARATPVWKNRGLVTALHTTSSDGMQLADIVGRAAVAQLTQV